jgi:hypothetical protein
MTEDNIVFTGNRKTRRALRRQKKKKVRKHSASKVLVSKPVPYDVNFISFTGTLKAFHAYNTSKRYSGYKVPIRTQDVQKWAILNAGNFFAPTSHFFFGCKPGHLQLGTLSKYNKRTVDGTKNPFRGNLRVPFELSRLGHKDLTPVTPSYKLTYKSLPPDLAATWNVFAAVIIKAWDDGRVYWTDTDNLPWWAYTVKACNARGYRSDTCKRFVDEAKRLDNYHDLEKHLLEINQDCCVVKDGKPVFTPGRAWEEFEHSYYPISNRRWVKKDLRNSVWRKTCKLAGDDLYGPGWELSLRSMKRKDLRTMKMKILQEKHIAYVKNRFSKVQREA